jgi:Fic family protein
VDESRLSESPIGQLVPISGTDARFGDYHCAAFYPDPLPDDINLSMTTVSELSRASASLARLDQACVPLKEPGLLIRPALFREALDTNALEGTYGQLSELLEARLPGAAVASAETREILGYVNAAQNAFEAVKTQRISLSVIKEAQAEMFKGSDDPPTDVGSIRTHQVWIGPDKHSTIHEARFVPLPGDDRLNAALDAWIEWIEKQSDWPPVLRAALSHYQFETLHPFGDGNGRIGRLLITLQLLQLGAISNPAVTVSPWFLRHRSEYQDGLFELSCTGDWNPWIQFFCKAISSQCDAVMIGATALAFWLESSRARVNEHKWAGAIYDVLDALTQWPMTSVTDIAQRFEMSHTAASNIVGHLEEIGVLAEMTGRNYGRQFGATDVMRIVENI